MIISAGRTVAITYTLTLDNGDTIDSNVDGEPLTYTHGTETLIAGLEKALEGLRRGDSATVHISPSIRSTVPSSRLFSPMKFATNELVGCS